jgi:hypothetical protein
MPAMACVAGVLAIWWPGRSNIPLVLTPLAVMAVARMGRRKAVVA